MTHVEGSAVNLQLRGAENNLFPRTVIHTSFLFHIVFMCMNVLSVCMYMYCMHAQSPQESQEGFKSLELELQMIMSHYVSVGN